jgi:hypothetical protein
MITEQPVIGTSPYITYGRNRNLPLYSTTDNRTFTGLNVKTVDIDERTVNTQKFVLTTKYSFRPDLISYYFYQNPMLGWYICEYNGIIDPFDPEEGLYAGRLITIPSKTKFITEQF